MLTRNSSKRKISLIIINWNGKNDTIECLHSVKKINYPHFDIIVVDNGSTDDSISVLKKEFPDITLLETKENLGFAGGNNVGIRHAFKNGADAVLLLNNDTVVDPELLNAFVSASSQNPQIGIIGARIYLYSQRDQLDHIGGAWNSQKADFDLIGNRVFEKDFSWNEKQDLDYVCGAAFYVKREVFEKIGFLEEKYFLYWEESDFCFRAKKAGFFVRSCPRAKIWHKVSASITGGKPHSTYYWWRNRLLWIERNCTKEEKRALYKRVLTREIMRLWKMRAIKSFENFLFRYFFSKQKRKEKEQKLLKYRAGWQGITDYSQGHFGKGPNWISQKRN